MRREGQDSVSTIPELMQQLRDKEAAEAPVPDAAELRVAAAISAVAMRRYGCGMTAGIALEAARAAIKAYVQETAELPEL